MRPIKISKFSRFDALCAAGVVLIASLTFMSVCRAKSQQLVQLVRRTNELSAQVADIHDVRSALAEAELRLENVKAGLAHLHRRIPDDLDTEGFLKDLNDVAAENRVVIVRVRPGDFSKQGSYRDAPVAVDATARFSDFYSFINALRDMPRLATVEDIDMRAGSDGLCNVSLSLRIYAYRETDDDTQEEEEERPGSA